MKTTLETYHTDDTYRYRRPTCKRTYSNSFEGMELITGNSETQPDETLTIKEIMLKHVKGMAIADSLARTPIWPEGKVTHDSIDMEALQRMDLADRSDFLRELKESNEEKLKNLQAEQAAIQAAQASDSAEADKTTSKQKKSSGVSKNDARKDDDARPVKKQTD